MKKLQVKTMHTKCLIECLNENTLDGGTGAEVRIRCCYSYAGRRRGGDSGKFGSGTMWGVRESLMCCGV